ncbi:hypothetical protein HK101_011065 [Irineochytrium annulatum]|nr:hypothetical protein HK101_011065 [Irineochytrium annulatum]
MAKKAAKAPGKSPKGGGKKSKKAGTATVPPPLPEYTFAGRTGDEARQAFAEAAAVLRAKLSDAVEHTHVILRVRQVAFDQHDFLLKLPKTAAVGRLQAEIAARQHCGAVTPQDVIVFRTLPDLETYPAGPVATAVGGNESKDASNVVGDVVAAPAVSNRLEPLSRLMDCIPEVGPFNTPTDVSSAAAQPLRQSTADDATPSPPSTPPIPVEKPSPYLGSIITFVHDIPAAQTPGYGQHNPANAPPQRKMTVTGSSNLPTRSFSIASVRDPDGSNSAPSAPTSGAPPAPNASSQLPLAGNYVSVYYDILPYTTVIPHPSLAAYFNATSSDNKAARTQSRSASAGPHHTRPSSSATHRTSRPASSRTATTMTASSGPSPMPGEPPASGRSSALPHHHRRPRGDDDAPLLGRRGRRAPPPIIKGLDRSCALLSLETGRGGFAASTARPGSPPRVLKMDPMLFAQQRNGRAEAAAAAAAAAVAAGRGKKGSVVGAMLGSTMIAAAAVRAAAVGGGEGGMPFLSSTERRRANSVVSAMSDLVERSAMAAAAAAAGDGAPRIDVVEELEEEDESAVEE